MSGNRVAHETVSPSPDDVHTMLPSTERIFETGPMAAGNIADQIKQRDTELEQATHPGPVIIAVEGFPGAGKSTFAAKLQAKLGDAYVIGVDDFYIKDKGNDADTLGSDAGELGRIDRDRLKRDVLLPLQKGHPAAYQPLDYPTNTLRSPIPIPRVKYLIIEGISTLHPSIAPYMDVKILVQAPKDTAQARGCKRDKEQGDPDYHLWKHWADTYELYVKNGVRPPEADFDFVVDNSTSHE